MGLFYPSSEDFLNNDDTQTKCFWKSNSDAGVSNSNFMLFMMALSNLRPLSGF